MVQADQQQPPVLRRSLLAAGALLMAPGDSLAAIPSGRRLAFLVFRNGVRVGDHEMSFTGEPGAMSVTTQVRMAIKLGPVPVFRYRHEARERWAGGRFSELATSTDINGKRRTVAARRSSGGAVVIETDTGRIAAPAGAAPLTHWNSDVLSGPLFNPQEGKMLKASARRVGRETVTLADGRKASAVRWSVRGEAEIDDWYDDDGVWTALRGKLPDGSTMEYRRV